MAKRPLINLLVTGQESSQGTRRKSVKRQTYSQDMLPIFDCSAPADCVIPNTKTNIRKQDGHATSADYVARKIAREKYAGHYIDLACGHFTDADTQTLYKTYAKRGRYWCEQCGRWQGKARKPRAPLPEEPPF